MDEESGQELVYEDEAVEVVSLGDGDDQPLEDIDGDLEAMELIDLDQGMEDGVNDDEEGSVDGGFIFQPLRDDSMACFSEHRGPVFVVSVDSSSQLVATGGQDDRGIVWKLSDKQVSFECTGHKDSVTCATFSHDSKYLATSDLSGLIQVWLTTTGKLIWSFETSSVEWLLWHGHAHILLAGTSDGEGWMWKIPSGECKTLPSHGCGNMAAILHPDGKSITCGYNDGSLKHWDLKTTSLLSSYIPSANQMSSVTCLSGHPGSTLIASGHIDGTTRLYNTSTLKLLGILTTQQDRGDGNVNHSSVESVGFIASLNLLVVGVVTGSVEVWDVPTQKLRHSCRPEKDECSLVKLYVSQNSPTVYSCHMDGIVRQWDALGGSSINEWHGHGAGILDVTLTRDESLILTSSDDATVRVYQIVAK